MASSERRYIHIDVVKREPISYERACTQVRAMAASGEDNALSSNVARTLTRIADGMDERVKANAVDTGAGTE